MFPSYFADGMGTVPGTVLFRPLGLCGTVVGKVQPWNHFNSSKKLRGHDVAVEHLQPFWHWAA